MPALTPQTADQKGISRSALYRGARQGRFERIARGIYVPTDATTADWDWLEATTRRPESTICLTSALDYHELTDTIPDAVDVAIPRGTRIPAASPSIAWHSFHRATFEVGRTEIQVPGSDVVIGMYSPERCLTDAFRLRSDIGYELARDALKEWLRRGGKPAHLIQVASQLPRAKRPVLHALDMLA